MKLDAQKTYLITGGSGFLGKKLVERLYEFGCKKIVIISRNEGNLVALKEVFPHIKIIPGDISDPYCAEKVIRDVDGIFHLGIQKK